MAAGRSPRGAGALLLPCCLLALLACAAAVDLSVVLCGRNDGHGSDITGDFASRLRQTVLALLMGFCQRSHRVRAEVVLVEWRPPNATRGLRALLREWVEEELVARAPEFHCDVSAFPGLRLITVSNSAADDAFRSVGQVVRPGMLEWYCKNVGLRRARGDLLLTINADDILSPALLNFLAHARHLRRDTFYLAQTTGAYLRQRPGSGPFYALYEEVFRHIAADAEQEAQVLVGQRRPEVAFSKSHNLCERPGDFWHSASEHMDGFWRSYDRDLSVETNGTDLQGVPRNFYDLYVGDFMLASRVAWRRINGAPMILQSIAIDHLVSCRFSAHALRQVVLVAPCFNLHQNHPHSMTLNKRRADAGRDWYGGKSMAERCRHPMRSLPTERGVKRRQWGFPKAQFPEVRFVVRSGALVEQSQGA